MENRMLQMEKKSKPVRPGLGLVLFVLGFCFIFGSGFNLDSKLGLGEDILWAASSADQIPAWQQTRPYQNQTALVAQPTSEEVPPPGFEIFPPALSSTLTPVPVPDESQVTVTIVSDDLSKPVIIIRADVIESDRNKSLNHFINRVSIIRGEETITADRAIWNDQTNTAELAGNITISTPDFVVMAERALINMSLYTAKIYGGKAFFPAQNYYLSGAVIERLGERVMYIKDGTATTCDGPNPPWTIHASELTVTEGGYAKASGVSFSAGSVPVLHMPWFIIPVKNERQSGLLVPMMADSSRDGFIAGLPAFWATGENHDLTFTPVWRSKRGLAGTIEGRYHLEEGQGIWAYTYMNDREHRSYSYTSSSKMGETGDRYWLRAQNQWRLGEWDVHLNLDLVSDPFFLAEFRSDIDGFYYSYDLFKNTFGHTVNEYLDPLRSNAVFAQKTSYDTLMRGGLEYTEDLYSENNADTIQRLPSLEYHLVGRALGAQSSQSESSSPVRLSLGMNYDYFYQTTNSQSLTGETGHRFSFSPTLSWSKPLADMATLEFDGNLNLLMYSANGHRPSSSDNATLEARGPEHDSFNSSLSSSFTGSLSTTFNRVFQGGPGESEAFRHQMTPKMSFTYVEAPDDQDELPYWDLLDRKVPRKTVRYGLENSFVSKTALVRPVATNSVPANSVPDSSGGVSSTESITSYNYFQFLKVDLWASYEFTDNLDWRHNPQARQLSTDYREKGAGPLELDVEAFFNPYLSMRLISGMDLKSGEFTGHDLSLRLQDTRGDSLVVAYDFDSPQSDDLNSEFGEYEEIRTDLGLVINSQWRADFTSRYDLRAEESLETRGTLLYQDQCYGLGLMFSEDDGDRRVGVVVNLLGLGSTSN